MKIISIFIIISILFLVAGYDTKAGEILDDFEKKKDKLVKKYVEELDKIEKYARKNKLEYDCIHLAMDIALLDPANARAQELIKSHKKEEKTASFKARHTFALKFAKTREKYSNKLFTLAGWCKRNKLIKEHEELMEVVLKLNPDNPKVRREMGQGYLVNYGWLKEESVKQIKKGKLEVGGKWIPKEDADKLHSAWNNAWVIKGNHFEVRTNASYEEGLKVLNVAEELYELMKCEFGRYVDVKNAAGLKIYYFATEKDFKENIPENSPNETGGIQRGDVAYVSKEKPPKSNAEPDKVLRHELTHLLCNNCIGSGGRFDFTKPGEWLLEGIAFFMESGWGKVANGLYRFGFPNEPWERGYKDVLTKEFIPMEELTVKTSCPRTATLGSQFHATVRMLFLNENTRPGLFKMLWNVHMNVADANTFEKVVGVKPSTLNADLKKFLANPPK
ncbi:MAG: hypothetical protein ACYS8W_14820 [Planctomycetota bacterium]|jgi:hypothetical protein